MKRRNEMRYEPLHKGDKVIVTERTKNPAIKYAKGTVIDVQDNARSPYKNICVVWLEGTQVYGNPHHLFRDEIEKLIAVANGNHNGNGNGNGKH